MGRTIKAAGAAFLMLLFVKGETCRGQESSALDEARKLLKNEQLTQAEAGLRNYLADHLTSVEGSYLLAFVLFRENKPQASLEQYTHAAQLKAPDASSLRIVALDYVLLNAYPEAEKWIRQSLALDDHDFEAWYDLGRILQMQGRSTEALSAFEHALTLEPGSVKTVNNLGLVYESLNRPEDAKKTYRQAILLQQGSAVRSEQPYLNLGILMTDGGELPEARSMLGEAAAIAPRDPKIREQLGRLDLREERWQEAETELKMAVSLGKDAASIHFLLGQAYRHLGKADLAKSEFARASELNGTHSSPTP